MGFFAPMEREVRCPSCHQGFQASISSENLAEYLLCTHCRHRFLYDPTAGPPQIPPEATDPQASVTEPLDLDITPGEPILDDASPQAPPMSPPPPPEGSPGTMAPPAQPAYQQPAPRAPAAIPGYGSVPQGGYGGGPSAPVYDWGGETDEPPQAGEGEYVLLFPTTSRPSTAGIILLLSAFMAIGYMIFIQSTLDEQAENNAAFLNDRLNSDVDSDFYRSVINGSIIAISILAVVSMVGGVMSLLRSSYNLARIGAIAGLVSMGPFLLSTLLSAVALWFIITSRGEFESEADKTPEIGRYAE